MISCKCMNVVVRLVSDSPEPVTARFNYEEYLRKQRQEPAIGDDHFLFFKEALGPVRYSSVQIQYDLLLRTVRLFDEWDLHECRNCACFVFARCVSAKGSPTETDSARSNTCLINPSLMTNEEQLSARMADGSYSPAFGIVLNGSGLSYSDLAEKGKLLSKAKSDNTFVQLLRAYMERETEAANARIHRFSEQEFAVLKVKRERAEQDCLILAKLANNVPELLLRSNSITESSGGGGARQTTPTAATMTTAKISPMTTVGANPNGANHLSDSTTSGSQLETPPPTPEYLPMSTGNSPPMTTATTNGRPRSGATTITPPSSADQSRQQPLGNRTNLSYNGNNNIVSFSNNTRGAIITSRQQQQQSQLPQHSSTNSLLQTQQQRLATSSFESDCMFEFDGMDNIDKSPLSNTLSDEEELGFDESTGNNNDDGIYIPSRHALGRQNSSIAKSLPISMPQVMTQFRANEEDYDEMAEDNVDIAASIKALARSVHGDTVFGDLPRPQVQRFSTQI